MLHPKAINLLFLTLIYFNGSYPPFVDEDPMGIYQKILSGKIVPLVPRSEDSSI